MRRRMFAWLGFFLTSSAVASAQDIVPPPGFSPAPGGTAAPPAARIVGDPENLPPAGDFDDPYGRRSQLSYDPTTPYSPYSPSPPVPAYFGADTWLAPRVWVRAEFLYWWTKASPVPAPLVTLGDPGDSIPGAIGQPGTSVLLGNQDIDIRGRPGGRFTLGIALDPERTWGLEGSYLFLANTSVTHGVFSDGSSGSPALFVPFFNPNLPGEDSTLLADPGAFAGSARLTIQSFFQGAEANLLYNVQNANGLRFDLLGGFRYLNLQESLL
ncbi:MAG TPA: BBP7 family outer membrane beta-barrel protein, partial [Planctomycetaceae bacterium]|nr:BBP7 family outer membrane beta-barrel protein [Planctomycetaceae bacterium]